MGIRSLNKNIILRVEGGIYSYKFLSLSHIPNAALCGSRSDFFCPNSLRTVQAIHSDVPTSHKKIGLVVSTITNQPLPFLAKQV